MSRAQVSNASTCRPINNKVSVLAPIIPVLLRLQYGYREDCDTGVSEYSALLGCPLSILAGAKSPIGAHARWSPWGCAARNRFIVDKASIRSRQAQIAGC